MSPDGSIYVADGTANRVQKFTHDGTFVLAWGTTGMSNGEFENAYWIATDLSGNVYVGEYSEPCRVQKFTSGGTYLATLGGGGCQYPSSHPGSLHDVEGVAVDASGIVYVASEIDNSISKFTSSGTYITEWPTGTNDAVGIALDDSNHVYVADLLGGRIRVFDSDGNYLRQIGSPGALDGQLNQPTGVAVDNRTRRVYVTDNGNHRVQEFTTTGIFAAKWGSQGTGNGQFAAPNGIAVDAGGRVYVVDATNDNVQGFGSCDLQVTPASGFASSGLQGGPFAPASANYSVANAAPYAISFRAVKTASWVTLNGADSVLASPGPGTSTPLQIAIGPAAASLNPGTYVDTVLVQQTNPASPCAATRVPVQLTVSPVPCYLSLAPAGGLTSSGPPGGPFSPSGITYTLSSSSASPVNYKIRRSKQWTSVNGADSLAGTLGAGGSAQIVVSINANANILGLGVAKDTIRFDQTGPASTCALSRVVQLTVVQLGVSSFSPDSLPTTALQGGNPITIRITGSAFDASAIVRLGGIQAQVTRASPAGDSLYATLPVMPPGGNCALQSYLAVPLTVTLGTQTVTAPTPFHYQIVFARVPEDYATIQAAVNAAIPGTCVSVAAGAYRENVEFTPSGSPRNKITLMSRTPTQAGRTRIEGGTSFTPTLPTVHFSRNDSLTILRGFEIVLGNSGIVVTDTAGVQILDNAIRDNFASGPGGGIAVLNQAHPTVQGNRIDQNEAGGAGGGLAIIGARGTFTDNNLLSNIAKGNGGGVDVSTSFPITLTNLRLYDNGSGGNGGGIASLGPGRITIDTCLAIRDTCSSRGGGIYLAGGWPATVLRSRVEGNRARGSGGGIYVDSSSTSFVQSTSIASNIADGGSGAGIFIGSHAATQIVTSTLQDNVQMSKVAATAPSPNAIELSVQLSAGDQGGGIFAGEFVTGRVDSNVICGNQAQAGGGISIGRKSVLSVKRNVVAFNVAVLTPSSQSASEPALRDADHAAVAMPVGPAATPPALGPGIHVFDAGTPIINNTIHANTGGEVEQGGGIDGEQVGVFQPDWINNIVSQNAGWGIYCRGQNSGVRIDYNLGNQNASGDFAPTIQIPGTVPFANNTSGNPLYIDPVRPPVGTFNFHLLDVTSPAVDHGDPTTGPDPDGTRTDIGAFYFSHLQANAVQPGPVVSKFSASPNPFVRLLRVQLVSRISGPLDVEVLDLSGRRVVTRRTWMQPGTTRLSWDGRDDRGVPAHPGIYFFRMTCPGWQQTTKVVMVE